MEEIPLLVEKIVIKGEDECWNWTAFSHRGHGQYNHKGKSILPHRYMWEKVNGPIPHGVSIKRTCGNGLCCNVKHMRLGKSGPNRNRNWSANVEENMVIKSSMGYSHKNRFLKKYGLPTYMKLSIKEISSYSGIAEDILQGIYDRVYPFIKRQSLALLSVYSFCNGGKVFKIIEKEKEIMAENTK